jgi:hypothetical protein
MVKNALIPSFPLLRGSGRLVTAEKPIEMRSPRLALDDEV